MKTKSLTTVLRLIAARITEVSEGKKAKPENLTQTTNERDEAVWKITTATFQYQKVGDDPGKLWTGEGFKTRVTKQNASLSQLATEFGDYWDQAQEPLPDSIAEIAKQIDQLVKQAREQGYDAKRFTKGEVKAVVFEKISDTTYVETLPDYTGERVKPDETPEGE